MFGEFDFSSLCNIATMHNTLKTLLHLHFTLFLYWGDKPRHLYSGFHSFKQDPKQLLCCLWRKARQISLPSKCSNRKNKGYTIKLQCIVILGQKEEYMLAVNMNDIVRYSQELEVRKVSLPTVVDFCFCCLPSNYSSQRLFFPYCQLICLWWSWFHFER